MSAPKKIRCKILGRGHHPNPIAVRRSTGTARRPGRLAWVEGSLITVFFGPGETLFARNHDTERLQDIVKIGGVVDVPVDYPSLLRTYDGYQFSIFPGGEDLEPCSNAPLGQEDTSTVGQL